MTARTSAIASVVIGTLLASSAASAAPLPTRSGETGFVEVPSADVVGSPGALAGAEFRLDRVQGATPRFGPLPLYGVAGVTEGLEVGFSMRQWGHPGDELQRTTFGGAAKLKLNGPAGPWPALALDVVLDQPNTRPTASTRLIASNVFLHGLRIGAFVGAELGLGRGASSGATAGGAIGVPFSRRLEGILEGFTTPRGASFGLATRWAISPKNHFQIALSYLPGDEGFRVSIGLLMTPRAAKEPDQPVPEAGAPGSETAIVEIAPPDDGPPFRLRMPTSGPELLGAAVHQQHAAFTGVRTASAAEVQKSAGPVGARASAPTLDDLAEAQLRDQEALADARERRVRSTADQLDAREKEAVAAAAKLGDLERELAARERQLAVREQRIPPARNPSAEQRQLDSLEAQLASQERQLAAQERSLAPTLDAATGRERDATTREASERQEASRLAASVSAQPTRSQQLEVRKQALGARQRQLAALEAHLVAKGERVDAVERQFRARSERLAAWARRLAARGDRLDLLENRPVEQRPASGTVPNPTETRAAPLKDKAVYAVVVKSPTALVREPSPAAGSTSGAGVQSGVAVEKAVAAATIVSFPTPSSSVSELDREAIDNVARVAAKEKCDVFVWARAKDPSYMAEAQRRAADLKLRIVAAGPLPETKVSTRITLRPGAQGVDVVVSAVREAAPPPPPPPPTGRTGPALEPGEGGKRQVREAMQAAQPSIEACVAETMTQRRIQRAEGVLKLTISGGGRASKVATTGGDLAGSEVEACLGAASRTWVFPAADSGYVVDVPITVVRGGAAP